MQADPLSPQPISSPQQHVPSPQQLPFPSQQPIFSPQPVSSPQPLPTSPQQPVLSQQPILSPQLVQPVINSDLILQQPVLSPQQPCLGRSSKRKRNSLTSSRLENMVDEILALMGPNHAYSPELLHLLLRTARASRDTQVGLPSQSSDFQEDLVEGYEGMGYSCMDNDTWRNEYYRVAIARISTGRMHSSSSFSTDHVSNPISSLARSPRHLPKPRGAPTAEPLHEWFEIGPGAKGTLSRMVLEEHPDNKLLAIEAVPSSAQKVRTLLKEYEERFRVVEGFAGAVAIPTSKMMPRAFVCELLGHFSTSEGYVAVLHACKRAYPNLVKSLKAAVPLYFGTKVVPVDLTPASFILVAAFEEKLVLTNEFPFAATQLVSEQDHGTMELYNALDILKGRNRKVYEFESKWAVASSRPFHGLAFYLCFGDSLQEPWHTANVDLGHSSTNWCNVFLPLGKGKWVVEGGDEIRCKSRCHVGTLQPYYTYQVRVLRAGVVAYSETASIGYHDLIPRVDSLRNWAKAAKQPKTADG